VGLARFQAFASAQEHVGAYSARQQRAPQRQPVAALLPGGTLTATAARWQGCQAIRAGGQKEKGAPRAPS